MTPELILELVLTAITAVAFAWGDFKFFRKGTALYLQMVTCAVGCAFLTRVFESIQIWRSGETSIYSLSMLGIVAEFLFLYCSNYGLIDSLCDDGSKSFIKYRLISAVIPVSAFVFSVVQYDKFCRMNDKAPFLIYIPIIVVLLAAYYHIKHLIIPDVENGIVRRIRPYNMLGVVNCFAVLMGFMSNTGEVLWYVSVVLCFVSTALLLPVLYSGVKKWTRQ